MPAPKGNEYYLLAKNFVKPKKYQPAALWKKALEYFEWNNAHPLKEEKVFGTGKRMTVKKMRAMTIIGFCNYACIDRKTYETYEKIEAYLPICVRIKDMIFQQKLEGAAADLLNPSIIAREVGLVDKKDITTDGESLNNGYYALLKARRTKKAINSNEA
jgi:hypothetical protein